MNDLSKIVVGNTNAWRLSSTDADEIAHRVRCWWPGHTNNQFPGPQPVSIERVHIQTLVSGDYRVCEKTDGERYLCACLKHNGLYVASLINRKQDVIIIPLTCETSVFDGTLLDGELVYDNQAQQYNFMVYDCIMAFGEDTSSESLDSRLMKATSVLSQFKTSKSLRIVFRVKELYPFSQMQQYVDTVVPNLTHGHDGYIFTPNNAPVGTGTHSSMFKWKEGLNNTVDFSLGKDRSPHTAYVMKNGRSYLLHNVMIHVPSQFTRVVSAGSIVECEYVSERRWSVIRLRDDKTKPNSHLTYIKTLLNIKEDIQLSEFYQG
jgi:hypothetical protein